MKEFFRKFAGRTAEMVGSPWMFITSVLIIVAWAATGPMAHYSDTWQLIINTGTTIITFLMVFLIQNTQNRDAKAIHIKLDELLFAMKRARTSLVDLENCTDEELEELQKEFEQISKRARAREVARGGANTPEKIEDVGDEKVQSEETRS
jgi:low affinity Fe/Cu permease